MAYLCVSNDCAVQGVSEPGEQNGDLKSEINNGRLSEQALNTKNTRHTDEEFIIPDYVCCVLTEGVWTIFAASLLIIGLFAIATLKYLKKRLAKTKYNKKNMRMKKRYYYLL